MKRLLSIGLVVISLAVSAYSRAHVQGIVERGGKVIVSSGISSTTKSVQTYPLAFVTVLQADGATSAVIYSTATGTALGNPFSAGSDASYGFYLDNSIYYLRFSGTGITTPWTVGPFVASDPSDVYNVLGFGAVCNGSTSDTVAIAAANTAAVAGGGSLYIPPSTGGCKIGAATLTAPIRSDGGSLLLTTGQVTTITSSLTIPPQIFFRGATAGLGTVSLSGNLKVGQVFPQWWGTVGDGVTDGLLTIQAALTAGAGHNVHFIAGNYLTSDGLAVAANTLITGDGYASKLICPGTGWNVHTSALTVGYGILNVKNVSKVRISNLRIYGTRVAPIDLACDAGFPRNCHTPKLIYLEGTGGASVVDGVMIDHNWLENSAWEGVWEGGSIDSTLHVQISNNQFKDIDGPSALTGNFERATIEDNTFQDCQSALGTTGRHVVITGNQIYGAVSQGIGVGEIGTDGFVEVSGNLIRISPTSAASWGGIQVITTTTTGQINITGNEVYVVDSLGSAAGAGIRVIGGGASVDINNNSVQGNGALVGIAVALGSVVGTSNASVRGNTVRLTSESATPNQSRGISLTNTTGTLIAQSIGNKVLGMTRANGNYAYDYRTAGGSITVVMEGDFKTNGDMQIGTATYATSETDNVPLFLSSDFTGNDAHIGRAMLGILRLRPTQSITIASGIITIAGLNSGNGLPYRQTRIILDTEGGGATDDLDTINGTQDGDVLILGSVNSGHDVTIKNGTGNIFCGTDFTLATTRDKLVLMSDGTNLYQISRSTN